MSGNLGRFWDFSMRTILPALRETHEDKASVWMTYFVGIVILFTFSHCLIACLFSLNELR